VLNRLQAVGPISRIVVDTRDASKDYFVPTEHAVRLYKEGRLFIDLTNSSDRYAYGPMNDREALRIKTQYGVR